MGQSIYRESNRKQNKKQRMSWQSYTDSIIQTNSVVRAVIIGLNPVGVWAESASANVKVPTPSQSAAEVQALVNVFTNSSGAAGSGFMIGGTKFMYLRSDDQMAAGKKGNDGFVAYKTGQCVVVGFYQDPIQPAACSAATSKVSEYLKSVGY
eukprot:c21015_g1_i1.p1 GENE.c21015_g1_i1~~c21015_g1_i1.p1  ORF type:complete len:152 (-),score=60.80 c21015_g1_i1:253-708(-)